MPTQFYITWFSDSELKEEKLQNLPSFLEALGFIVEEMDEVLYWATVGLELVSYKHLRFSMGAMVSSCSNTGSIRYDPYWTSRKNSLELIELSSINKVSLV